MITFKTSAELKRIEAKNNEGHTKGGGALFMDVVHVTAITHCTVFIKRELQWDVICRFNKTGYDKELEACGLYSKQPSSRFIDVWSFW